MQASSDVSHCHLLTTVTRTEQQLDSDGALLAAYRDHFGIVLRRVPDDPAAAGA